MVGKLLHVTVTVVCGQITTPIKATVFAVNDIVNVPRVPVGAVMIWAQLENTADDTEAAEQANKINKF